MPACGFCKKQVYNLMARGLCAACYQRQWKHGSPEYVKVRKPCTVEGCSNLSVAQGLCEKHYRRLKKHGKAEGERFDRWGHRKAHPLYDTWRWLNKKRDEVCPEWSDFWKFVSDVKERPPGHQFVRIDPEAPYSPLNVMWRPYSSDVPVKTKSERAEWMRAYRINNPRKFKNVDLKRMYGMDLDAYEALEKSQNGVCAICKRPEARRHPTTGEVKYLAVDHCHDSKKIRGLLCTACNHGLGNFQDDIDRLKAAIRYLKKHQ